MQCHLLPIEKSTQFEFVNVDIGEYEFLHKFILWVLQRNFYQAENLLDGRLFHGIHNRKIKIKFGPQKLLCIFEHITNGLSHVAILNSNLIALYTLQMAQPDKYE